MNNIEREIEGFISTPVIDTGDKELAKERLAQEFIDGDKGAEKQEDSKPEVANKIDREFIVPNDAIEKLSAGLLSLYVGDLKKMASTLSELTRNQSILIETLQQENTRFSEAHSMHNLDDLLARTKHYHGKLLHIKREMSTIHDRSSKLKKRALRLQQQKQKEALKREDERERAVEREKQLVPKVVAKS